MPAPSSRSGRGKPIGELLIESNAITPEQLARAIAEQNNKYDLLGRILVRRGACGKAEILSALQAQYRVTTVDIGRTPIDPTSLDKVTKEICESGRLIPFDLIGSTICVAMTNVLNRKAIQEIESATGFKVKAFQAPWMEIKKIVTAYFDKGGAGVEMAEPSDGVVVSPDDVPPPAAAAPAPAVQKPAPPPKQPAPAVQKTAPPPTQAPPPVSAPALAGDAAEPAVVPFSGRTTARKQKKSAKHDTMRMLKSRLMKEKGPAKETGTAVAAEDIILPGAEEKTPPPEPQAAPPPVPAPVMDEAPPPLADVLEAPAEKPPAEPEYIGIGPQATVSH
ncbi:MAG TPA: hypothetical protein ENN09_00845, partial [Planctomycetes bacterium]|nr:hypothetical protein [Planctomycetota bacterium]